MSEHVRFPVEGMTCGSCVARITRALRGLEGVIYVKVDLGTDTAAVEFDPSTVSLVAIAETVERAGYEPRLGDAEPWTPGQRLGLIARLGYRR